MMSLNLPLSHYGWRCNNDHPCVFSWVWGADKQDSLKGFDRSTALVLEASFALSDQFFSSRFSSQLRQGKKKMSNQRLSVLSPLLFFGFFRESFSICDGTTWTKVGWEIFPEEVHYLKVQVPPSHCLPYPLDKLCCNFANKDLLQSSLHLTYILVQALFLILFVLSVHYLWMKWTRHQKKVNLWCKYEDL